MTKNYSLSADIIRIFAAFFVVFSHSTDPVVLWTGLKWGSAWWIVYYMNTLSRVAVPVFVILSGYLILRNGNTDSLKNFYKKRFLRILIPFIAWLTIYYGWTVYWDQTQLTPQYIFNSLLHGSVWHLYFLFIILELYILTPFMLRFMETSSRYKQTLLFWALLCFSIFWAILANLPGWHFDITSYSFTMFLPYIGYYYAGGYLRTVTISGKQATIFGCLYLILGVVTNLISRGNMSDFFVFNYSPTLLPMSIFFFLALKNVDQFFNKKILPHNLTKVILFVASTTFGIYLLHFLMLDLVRKYLDLNPWQLHTPIVLYACLLPVVTFLLTFFIVAIGKRIPYVRYIFG